MRSRGAHEEAYQPTRPLCRRGAGRSVRGLPRRVSSISRAQPHYCTRKTSRAARWALDDVLETHRAADRGAGVLRLVGNYGGDKMSFEMAADVLKDEGPTTATVIINDDIASAEPSEAAKRLGVRPRLRLQDCGCCGGSGPPAAGLRRHRPAHLRHDPNRGRGAVVLHDPDGRQSGVRSAFEKASHQETKQQRSAMIEGISAVTPGTHEMPRAVRF